MKHCIVNLSSVANRCLLFPACSVQDVPPVPEHRIRSQTDATGLSSNGSPQLTRKTIEPTPVSTNSINYCIYSL